MSDKVKFYRGKSYNPTSQGDTESRGEIVFLNDAMNDDITDANKVDSKLGSIWQDDKIVGTTRAKELCLDEDIKITRNGASFGGKSFGGVLEKGTSLLDLLKAMLQLTYYPKYSESSSVNENQPDQTTKLFGSLPTDNRKNGSADAINYYVLYKSSQDIEAPTTSMSDVKSGYNTWYDNLRAEGCTLYPASIPSGSDLLNSINFSNNFKDESVAGEFKQGDKDDNGATQITFYAKEISEKSKTTGLTKKSDGSAVTITPYDLKHFTHTVSYLKGSTPETNPSSTTLLCDTLPTAANSNGKKTVTYSVKDTYAVVDNSAEYNLPTASKTLQWPLYNDNSSYSYKTIEQILGLEVLTDSDNKVVKNFPEDHTHNYPLQASEDTITMTINTSLPSNPETKSYSYTYNAYPIVPVKVDGKYKGTQGLTTSNTDIKGLTTNTFTEKFITNNDEQWLKLFSKTYTVKIYQAEISGASVAVYDSEDNYQYTVTDTTTNADAKAKVTFAKTGTEVDQNDGLTYNVYNVTVSGTLHTIQLAVPAYFNLTITLK